MIDKRDTLRLVACLLMLIVSLACASRKYVDRKVELSEARLKDEIDQVETQVEETQTEFDQRIQPSEEEVEPKNDHAQVIAELPEADRQCALQALERATSAGDLTEGRITEVISLSDTAVTFPSGKSELTENARLAIDDAFARIAGDGFQGLVIEVQGHTDATGETANNRELGLRRAQSVATHLQEQHGFPGNRIRVISYGETVPIHSNDTTDGREANRRVTLVALR